MDASAIKEIERLAVTAGQHNQLDTAIRAIVLQDCNGVQHIESLERFQANRARFRGTYATTSMQDFMAYVVAHERGEGFIDTDNMNARVIFNLHVKPNNPPTVPVVAGHGDHSALLTLRAGPEYTALRRVAGSPALLSQKQLVESLEDWPDCWAPDYPVSVATMGDPGALLGRAIATLRKVKIRATKEAVHTDKDFGASRSMLEDIEASSDAGLPRGFRFTCTPYDGFDESEFYVRLSVHPDPDKPGFKLRWPHLQRDCERLGQEFKTHLLDGIGDKATLLLGAFDLGK